MSNKIHAAGDQNEVNDEDDNDYLEGVEVQDSEGGNSQDEEEEEDDDDDYSENQYSDDDDDDDDDGYDQPPGYDDGEEEDEIDPLERELKEIYRKGEKEITGQEFQDDYFQEDDREDKVLPEVLREALVKKVKELINQGNTGCNQAITYLTGYISSNLDKHPEIFQLRADAYMKQKKYIEALHDVEQANILDQKIECAKSCKQHYAITKSLMRMSNDF